MKVAIIGCGGIGEYHLSHLIDFDDVELVGFCDLIPERAQAFVERTKSGQAFTDYKHMYDATNPEAVFICVPPYAHGEIEFETINRKIPFFVEKPVTLDMELAKQINKEIKKTGLVTAVGFQCRYADFVEKNREFTRENEIIYILCTRIGSMPGVPWWREKSLSGGQIVEQTVHQYDMIRYVYGEPETVFTFGARGFIKDVENYDTDDLSTTVVKFKDGALATIATGCYASDGNAFESNMVFGAKDTRAEHKLLNKLEIYGEAGVIKAEKSEGFVIANDGGLKSSGGPDAVYYEKGDAGVRCDRRFLDAVIARNPKMVLSDYDDAVRTLAFVLACNISIDSGKPINIDDLL